MGIRFTIEIEGTELKEWITQEVMGIFLRLNRHRLGWKNKRKKFMSLKMIKFARFVWIKERW